MKDSILEIPDELIAHPEMHHDTVLVDRIRVQTQVTIERDEALDAVEELAQFIHLRLVSHRDIVRTAATAWFDRISDNGGAMSGLRFLRTPLLAITFLVVQVYRAGHRKDLPSFQNQDPSGVFGDPDSPQLRVTVLGDSSVTAPGVEPLDAAWPRSIARHLSDRYRVEVISVAVGGSKTRDVLADQVPAAIATQPDIAFVSVGANDALRATPLAQFESEYRQILSQLSRHVPGVAVSGIGDLGSIPRLPELARSIVRIRGRSFDRAIRRAVADSPGVLKTNTWAPGFDEFRTNPEEVFAGDLFHASAYGHRIYTRAALTALEELLTRDEICASG